MFSAILPLLWAGLFLKICKKDNFWPCKTVETFTRGGNITVSDHFSRLVRREKLKEGFSKKTISVWDRLTIICCLPRPFGVGLWDHFQELQILSKQKIWLHQQSMSRMYICIICYLNICQNQNCKFFPSKKYDCTTNAAALCMSGQGLCCPSAFLKSCSIIVITVIFIIFIITII